MKTFEALGKVEDRIQQYKSKIEKLQKEFLEEIINDNDLSKVDKLELISKNKLYDTQTIGFENDW